MSECKLEWRPHDALGPIQEFDEPAGKKPRKTAFYEYN